MKIERINAREIEMDLLAPFETSFGVMKNRRILLLEVITDQGIGWGELTAPDFPFYNSETIDTAWLMLDQFLVPLVLGVEFDDVSTLSTLMTRVRGHEMAKGTLETAVWDAVARSRGISLASMLGGTLTEIPCGVSLGIHTEVSALLDRIAGELSAGYQRVKLKIKPGKDVEVVAAVRARYPQINLTVDANSAYTLAEIDLLRQLDDFGLDYIEQPLQWNEIYRHAELQRQLKTPICLDECIHSLRDVEASVELEAARIINIKLGRVGGHAQASAIQDYCRKHDIPVWSGGMLETGIGRAHNIAMSSLPGFTLPGDVSASERYWARDITTEPIRVTPRGTIVVPAGPGTGFEPDHDYIRSLTSTQKTWAP
ncbi:MAG: o-succinylbenzoate synthase [Edaphobacter sp.]|uniref:o-succinylbenzoate synthase n=1 Tax=Edaphobacter sp. TaxID=1934404 RepID=UPI002384DB3C|nr:o-succinylbenzoate synthase [Edaphobacter sp.]MDE1175828.1 o-succinylbenzoate synthase [Edaphobacter sp.]